MPNYRRFFIPGGSFFFTHGLVRCPRKWPWSSFHCHVKAGVYPPNWGCLGDGVQRFDDLDETAVE